MTWIKSKSEPFTIFLVALWSERFHEPYLREKKEESEYYENNELNHELFCVSLFWKNGSDE